MPRPEPLPEPAAAAPEPEIDFIQNGEAGQRGARRQTRPKFARPSDIMAELESLRKRATQSAPKTGREKGNVTLSTPSAILPNRSATSTAP